ncbi:SMR family transporter [Brachybacterium sp. p3-SID957]|uniref:DMT family transporter n=1 Tax=Brachybacterium sp. p3-SID957 TaxID=2916049 RepID=UPI0028834243|nr:SMR family transporter [Brachybacterium sp. p3-SID957]
MTTAPAPSPATAPHRPAGRSVALTSLLLAAAIVVEMAATLSLKGAIAQPMLYVVVVAGYAGAFGLLAVVLRRGMGLAVAYGIWGAMGVVGTAMLSSWIFGEQLNAMMAAGIALVVTGVLAIEVGAQRARRATAVPAAGEQVR